MPSAGESSLLFAVSSWTVGSGVVPERWCSRLPSVIATALTHIINTGGSHAQHNIALRSHHQPVTPSPLLPAIGALLQPMRRIGAGDCRDYHRPSPTKSRSTAAPAPGAGRAAGTGSRGRPVVKRWSPSRRAGSVQGCCRKPRISPPGNIVVWMLRYAWPAWRPARSAAAAPVVPPLAVTNAGLKLAGSVMSNVWA